MNQVAEVFKLHSASRERLVQFLTATAGAATAFCVTLQDSLLLAWPDILVIIATGFFAFSFWAGIRTVRHMQHILYINVKYLQQLDEYANSISHQQALREIVHESAFDPIQKKVSRWSAIQSYTIVGGAVILMTWRIAKAYPAFQPTFPL